VSVVEEIKDRLDIVELISAYVPLKKTGRNYKGLCPFHSEKTPSFVVFPDTGTWHCFGACGTGGDAFSFIMKRENVSFAEALEMLASRTGVELRPRSAASEALLEDLERLRKVMTAAEDYFHDLLLHSPSAERAREYLADRGLTQETVLRFRLGYAPDAWRSVSEHLLALGFRPEELLTAGLIVEREDGTRYDRFRHRLMIPIRDLRGRVIAFGARALDDRPPKYLNSPQTPLFDKSKTLFGLDLARHAIRAQGQAIIVEGYMDVMIGHQHGVANLVASMGTALTEAQLRLLKRYTKTFVLALDADMAGDQATLRGITLAREALDREVVPVPTAQGLIRYEGQLDAEIRILTLPPGQDPDQVIRTDPSRWAALLEAALPVVEYYMQVVLARLDLQSPKGKAAAVAELAPILREITSPVERAHHVQRLARRLQIDEAAVWQELHRINGRTLQRIRPGETSPGVDRVEQEEPLRLGLEEHCLAHLLARPELLAKANAVLTQNNLTLMSEEDFTETSNREIFALIRKQAYTQVDYLDLDELRTSLATVLHPNLDKLLDYLARRPALSEEKMEKDFIDAVLRLRMAREQAYLQRLRFLQDSQTESSAEITGQQEIDRVSSKDLDSEVAATSRRLHILQAALRARTMLGQREAATVILINN